MRNVFVKLTMGLAAGALLVFNASCDKEEECANPGLTAADIVGKVSLYDDADNPVSNSGMRVSIYQSEPLIFDTTDENGNFRLTNIPFDVYSLHYEKDGFGSLKNGIDHANNCETSNTAQELILGQKSTTTINSFNYTITGITAYINVGIYPEATDEHRRFIRMFFHDQSDVSNATFTAQSGLIEVEGNSHTVNLNSADFHAMGFMSGTIVYVKVYGESFYSNDYFDVELGREVYPNNNIVTQPNLEIEVP